MTGHQDVYFKYMFDSTPSLGLIYQIDTFTFNENDYQFECDKAFMNVNPSSVIVYACKEGDTFKPWLLQLYGHYSNVSCNYFFKRDENNVFKNHQFESLTVPSGSGQSGSIEPKQDEGTKSSLNDFTSLKASGLSDASAAKYYEFKESSGRSSIIQPDNLASYLQGESDKIHKYVSGSEDYVVTSFSSGSGDNPKFEITFKGRQKNKSGSQEQEKTVTYYTDGSSSIINQKGQPSTTNLSGSGSSCQANQAKKAVVSSGTDGGSGSGGSPQSQEASSQDSDETVAVEGSPGSTEAGPAGSTGSPEKSQSSSNLPWIVGGTVIGSVGLIGTGILIYKCIR
ncbi:hypothetical protein BdWA1_001003 [Babesia duncani]|uniref:Uncharacterized protein n=1 Tax=Babesia duncani TaxID=323732 RepID=A0AAD9PN76_9APIC|nr:hypothetical protein BdWA1_001003 [Babesia duncani]